MSQLLRRGLILNDNVELWNCDNLELMAAHPDGYFDLAIVDPPYGIGENWRKDKHSKFYTHKTSYKNNTIPGQEYFSELFRVSKNQIIFGGNYYTEFLKPTNSWLIWDKDRDYSKTHLSECELAWTSYKIPSRIAKFVWNGFCTCEVRSGIHPHEKPVMLYEWILVNYANTGDKILDTHHGSASLSIAVEQVNNDLMKNLSIVSCEIEETYYMDAINRIKDEQFKRTFAI